MTRGGGQDALPSILGVLVSLKACRHAGVGVLHSVGRRPTRLPHQRRGESARTGCHQPAGYATTAPLVTEAAAEFARFLRFWADTELRGYCPVYESIARPLADDTALLERVAHVAPRQKIVPVLLFAAVKSLVDRQPASPLGRIYADGEGNAWAPFRDFLVERFDEIAELLRTRRTQTNEVARASATLLALGLAERRLGRSLALIELGPSAGLNLLLDRFSYDYGGGRTAGDAASAVRLACETKGPLVPPIPARTPA